MNSLSFFRKWTAFCLLIVFALAGKVNAAGSLDTTFGAGGIAFGRVGTTSIGNDMAIQADGKIVVAGYTPFSGGGDQIDFAVARFNANGTIDTSFGIGGKVITPIGTSLDIANTVAIQADGKIIVAGISRGTTNIRDDGALVRYNADGSLDTTFDGDGKVVTSIVDGDEDIYAIAIQPDGKIIAVGTAAIENTGNAFTAARYNSNGSLDTSFDGDGKVTTFLRNIPVYDEAYEIALQPDGKILVAGASSGGANGDFDFALVRYNPNGSLDTSFEDDGKAITRVSPTNSSDGASGIALQPDGKIVAVGSSQIAEFNYDSAVLRYNANGSLDTSFDGDGKVYVSFGNLIETLGDVAIQPDGKIVAAGYKSNPSPLPFSDITVARLNPNGSLDTTFDGDGKAIAQIPTPYASSARALKIQSNGKITTAGSKSDGDAEFVVARFMGDVNTADFDGDTKTDVSIFRPSNGQWWFLRSSDGSNYALTFGVSTDKIVPADYTGDGKTDVAVYRASAGEWYILRSEDFSFYAFPFGISSDTPVPADYDGDSKADAAVFRASTGTWYINNSNGGTEIIGFGASGDKPVVADYDGDGKADIAIFRPNGASDAEWWIRRSSNASNFAVAFGTSADKAVPGDYTGDGKADISVWQPSDGNWSVLRSEDFSYYSFIFGASTDLPVGGDYDGDGRFDAAVFRPSNSTWFVQNSTSGTTFQTFGTSGDIPTPNAFVH